MDCAFPPLHSESPRSPGEPRPRLEPRGLRGSVVAIPVANVLACRARSRMAPQDGEDMDRFYPGRPLEKAMHLQAHTEVVLHTLFSSMQQYSNVVVDCHDGSAAASVAPCASYYAGPADWERGCRDLANRSGMAVVWKVAADFVQEKLPGSLVVRTARAGIPSIVPRVGGRGRLDPWEPACMHLALVNCLRHLEMVDGEAEIVGPQTFISRATWLRAAVGGTFWASVKPLQRGEGG